MNASDPPGPVRKGSGMAPTFLILIGLYVILGLSFLGWAYFRREHLEWAVLRVLIGFLFLFVAGLIIEKNRIRRRIDEVYEALNMLLYGKNFRRDREAVAILLKGLESSDEAVREKSWENLKRLTGQQFACDAEVWRSWWAASEKRFALKTKRPDE